MNRLSVAASMIALVLAIAIVIGGCQKKAPVAVTTPGAGMRAGDPPFPPIPDDDPEVFRYCRSKGWFPSWDRSIRKTKPIVYMKVEVPANKRLTTKDYQMIARSKAVQFLDLIGAECTDEGLTVLAGSPRLEGIRLQGNEISDAGIKELARAKSLEIVELFSTKRVTDAGIKELAVLPNLNHFYFDTVKLTGSAFEPFAGSKTLNWIGMRSLEGFTDEGARNLARLPNLEYLSIKYTYKANNLTTAGIKSILDAHLPATFEFDNYLIDDDLLAALIAKGWFYGLGQQGTGKKASSAAEVKDIDLSFSKVTDKGFLPLLQCTNVKSVFLKATGVTDETVKNLAKFKKLEVLALSETKVTGSTLPALSSLRINDLTLGKCKLSEDTFKTLAPNGFSGY